MNHGSNGRNNVFFWLEYASGASHLPLHSIRNPSAEAVHPANYRSLRIYFDGLFYQPAIRLCDLCHELQLPSLLNSSQPWRFFPLGEQPVSAFPCFFQYCFLAPLNPAPQVRHWAVARLFSQFNFRREFVFFSDWITRRRFTMRGQSQGNHGQQP